MDMSHPRTLSVILLMTFGLVQSSIAWSGFASSPMGSGIQMPLDPADYGLEPGDVIPLNEGNFSFNGFAVTMQGTGTLFFNDAPTPLGVLDYAICSIGGPGVSMTILPPESFGALDFNVTSKKGVSAVTVATVTGPGDTLQNPQSDDIHWVADGPDGHEVVISHDRGGLFCVYGVFTD